MIGQLLDGIRPGEVQLVRCGDVAEVIARLTDGSEQEGLSNRIVVCHWKELPETGKILRLAIESLARTALAIWPNWYGKQSDDAIEDFECVSEQLPHGVCPAWIGAAAARCRCGLIPVPPKFAMPAQAAQLALAIEPERLCFVLAQSGHSEDDSQLLGLARAAEWLAMQTQSRVAVLVPDALASAATLDSINFKTACISTVAPPPTSKEKECFLVVPFYGRPHPDSPGEQLLAKYLSRDRELAGMFVFNHRIQTVRGHFYTVDLLCEKARLVVEVDGFGWHSTQTAFRQDRHRDYELTLSGYSILRLTHDEVMEDVVLAIEKIRDMVAHCQGHLCKGGNV